jgi:type IV pilus assembly protein PilA
MKRPSGFTLIELMIVIAIVAILVALAITAYTKSITKAQLSEAFSGVDGLKSDVLTHYGQVGMCPVEGITGGLAGAAASYAGKYVGGATVASVGTSCIITVMMRNGTISPPLRGKQIVFTIDPSVGTSSHWSCSSDVDSVYLPETCR